MLLVTHVDVASQYCVRTGMGNCNNSDPYAPDILMRPLRISGCPSVLDESGLRKEVTLSVSVARILMMVGTVGTVVNV